MKVENQVCSIEIAKQLKEIGVKQESAFYWVERCGSEGRWALVADDSLDRAAALASNDFVSAFTLAELVEFCSKDFKDLHRTLNREWVAKGYSFKTQFGSSPQEAVARLLMALQEK